MTAERLDPIYVCLDESCLFRWRWTRGLCPECGVKLTAFDPAASNAHLREEIARRGEAPYPYEEGDFTADALEKFVDDQLADRDAELQRCHDSATKMAEKLADRDAEIERLRAMMVIGFGRELRAEIERLEERITLMRAERDAMGDYYQAALAGSPSTARLQNKWREARAALEPKP